MIERRKGTETVIFKANLVIKAVRKLKLGNFTADSNLIPESVIMLYDPVFY